MNAKEEFLVAIKNSKASVKCVSIVVDSLSFQGSLSLRINYSKGDFENFLSSIDFNYDDGYGGQELFGNIWMNDGTWFSRWEYDGSEGWEYQVCPPIPIQCLFNA